jgi:hypothetical protein
MEMRMAGKKKKGAFFLVIGFLMNSYSSFFLSFISLEKWYCRMLSLGHIVSLYIHVHICTYMYVTYANISLPISSISVMYVLYVARSGVCF